MAIGVVALLAAACGSSDASGAGPSATQLARERPPTGGTLAFANPRDISSFNVNTVEGSEASSRLLMERVWPQVFLIGPGYRPILDSQFVTSVELVSTDPQTVVYNLNPRAVWSDGVPITADDFIYNWKAQSGTGKDINGAPYDVATTAGYANIRSVTGSSHGHTVTVVFSQPYSDWESLFNNLIPAHIARRVGWNHGFDSFDPSTVISGGPFVVRSSVPGQEVTLGRNTRYWGPKARLDQIVFKLVGDPATQVASLQSGAVGLIYPADPSPVLDSQARQIPHAVVASSLGLAFEHLDFNQRSPLLADLQVRQAIAKGIDRQALIDEIYHQTQPGLRPDGNHLFVNTAPGYQDNGTDYAYDPEGAKSLLEHDGFQLGADGYFAKAGKALEMRISTTADSPMRLQLEQLIVNQLRTIGVKADPVNLDSHTFFATTLPSGDFDLALFEWATTAYPASNASIYQTTDQATGAGSDNFVDYSNPQVDAEFDQASAQLNQARAFTLYNQIDQQLWADMVSLPLFQVPTLLAHSTSYTGISDNPGQSGPFWNAETWRWAPRSPKRPGNTRAPR